MRKKDGKKHSSSTRGRERDVERMSQAFSTCGFPLGSKPIPIFHTASLFSSHREPSVTWNRNQLFTSSMCEAAQLQRGNPGDCSRSRVQIGSYHQVTSPVLSGELFPLYRINNSVYRPDCHKWSKRNPFILSEYSFYIWMNTKTVNY